MLTYHVPLCSGFPLGNLARMPRWPSIRSPLKAAASSPSSASATGSVLATLTDHTLSVRKRELSTLSCLVGAHAPAPPRVP